MPVFSIARSFGTSFLLLALRSPFQSSQQFYHIPNYNRVDWSLL